jgi:hypothetical protein
LWKFDECTGTTAYDLSGQGNNGTITIGGTGSQTSAGNCATVDTTTAWYNGKDGKYNSSLAFDGVNDYVTSALTGFDNTAITLSAWVKKRSNPSGFSQVVGDSGVNGGIYVNDATGEYFGQLKISDVVRQTPQVVTVTNGEWAHIVVTWSSGDKIKLYKNGVLGTQTAATFSGTINTFSGINIGFYSDGTYLDAVIDDVRVYNYALTPTQIRTLYNENAAVRFGPLTGSP